MRKQLQITFFLAIALLGLVTNLQAQDQETTPDKLYSQMTPAQKKEVQEKYLDEFLDWDMFLDVIASRRFTYVDDNNLAGQFGNRKLRQTIDYVSSTAYMSVCVACKIDKEHFWVKWMSAKGKKCVGKTEGKQWLEFTITLKPLGDRLYKPVITYAAPLNFNSQKVDTVNIQAFKAYMQDSLPSLKSEEFISKLNDRIVGALLTLLGQKAPPIYATLTPLDACGYDSAASPLVRQYYPEINIQKPSPIHGQPNIVKWASVKKGSQLKVKNVLEIPIKDSLDSKKQMQLKKGEQVVHSFTVADSVKEFTISGFGEDEYEIKTVSQLEAGKGVDILLGQLNVASYKERNLKVVVVPINNTTVGSETEIKKELNKIFNPAIVNWDVTVDKDFVSHQTVIAVPDDLSSAKPYDATMSELIEEYKKKIQRNTYYIFVTNKFSNFGGTNVSTKGYMPFQRKYGFVVSDSKDLNRTIAHELGHGAFGLKHSFNAEYNIQDNLPQGANNLMGYTNDHHLAKFQWDIIQKWEAGADEFDSTAEAALVGQFYKGIGFWEIAQYKYKKELVDYFSEESRPEGIITYEDYTITPHYNTDYDGKKKLSFYLASRDINSNKEARFEYIIGKESLQTFKKDYILYKAAANAFYISGIPSESTIQYIAGLTTGNVTDALAGLGNQWAEALTNPEWWINLGTVILAPQSNNAKLTSGAQKVFATIRSATTKGFYSGLSKLGNLGYKMRLVSNKVCLYTNLNAEIASFSQSGILKPGTFFSSSSTAGYGVVQTFDDVTFINSKGTQVTGKLELLQKGNETPVWRVVNVTRHANWVEVTNIRTKILAKKTHVLSIEIPAGRKGFTGCHSKVALDDYVLKNPGAKIEFKNKNLDVNSGVYEAEPIIKMPDGTEYVKTNNSGKSTFFPDNWNETKILDEVEYAIQNNHGKFQGGSSTEYYEFSKNGKIEIHFYLSTDGNVNSYFPIKK